MQRTKNRKHSQENKNPVESYCEINQMLELTNKDLKIVIITLLNEVKEHVFQE